jgi:hypothetical protein
MRAIPTYDELQRRLERLVRNDYIRLWQHLLEEKGEPEPQPSPEYFERRRKKNAANG